MTQETSVALKRAIPLRAAVTLRYSPKPNLLKRMPHRYITVKTK
jgi:hypothetical protein